MLKQIQVFDKEIFKKGTPVKVHFPGYSNNDFFAIVKECHLERLHLITILSSDNKVVQYSKNRVTWYHEDEDVKSAVIKIEAVLAKDNRDKVELLLLENAFNIKEYGS